MIFTRLHRLQSLVIIPVFNLKTLYFPYQKPKRFVSLFFYIDIKIHFYYVKSLGNVIDKEGKL